MGWPEEGRNKVLEGCGRAYRLGVRTSRCSPCIILARTGILDHVLSAFYSPEIVAIVTLSGNVILHALDFRSDNYSLTRTWGGATKRIVKANALVVLENDANWLVVAGVGDGHKGFVEILKGPDSGKGES